MGGGGQVTEAAQEHQMDEELKRRGEMADKDSERPSVPADSVRPIGQTEQGWMKAFEGGTGHTALGVLLRAQLDKEVVQRAVEWVLQENPRARSVLLLPPSHMEGTEKILTRGTGVRLSHEHEALLRKGTALLLVPEKGNATVKVETGWHPRKSMEQLAGGPQKADQGDSHMHLPADSPSGERIDMCFEIGRRWEPVEPPTEKFLVQECSCGCGCLGDGAAPAGEGTGAGDPEENTQGGNQKAETARRGALAQEGAGDKVAHVVSDNEKLAGDVACGQKCCCGVTCGRYKLSMCSDKWLQIVEAAMNEPWEPDEEGEDDEEDEGDAVGGIGREGCIGDRVKGSTEDKSTEGSGEKTSEWADKENSPIRTMKLLRVTLHRLPPWHSLLLMHVHTMACDRVSAALLMEEILKALKKELTNADSPSQRNSPQTSATSLDLDSSNQESSDGGSIHADNIGCDSGAGEDDMVRGRRQNLKSVEDCIPKKLSSKPIWAHGLDVLGYGLGSRRHGYLPFNNSHDPRTSQLIRSGLSRPDTDLLLQACTQERTSMCGVLSAAVLKAAAESKALGKKAEHFGVTTLLDLRAMLRDELHERTMGFYHSAMMNTHQVNEETDLWDLARRCHSSISHAISKRKQFTDMGDLLMLMGQAMQHPNLTPSGSLRTSTLSIFKDTLFENMEPYIGALGVEDYIGCASVHGVGPCLAVFDSIREDGLHMANVYPAPLFSRSQMRRLIIYTMEVLHKAIAAKRCKVVSS